jgi:hypothetical protein
MYRKHLPDSLAKLKDNPGRSVIGLAIEKMGIAPEEHFKDYIEFYMAEKFAPVFKAHGIDFAELTDPASITPEIIARAQEILVSDLGVLTYLMHELRPGLSAQLAGRGALIHLNRFRQKFKRAPCLFAELF